MKRNIIRLLVCMCLFVSLFCVPVFADDVTVTLTEDLILEKTVEIGSIEFDKKEVKINAVNAVYDLNGHTISMAEGCSGSIFSVGAGSTLTIKDSAGGGKITGGNALESEQFALGGAYIGSGSTCGGGVYVENGAKLIMEGGSITGCRALQGGGVFLEGGAELHVSGNAVIDGNYRGEEGTKADNIWLPLDTSYKQACVIVDGALDSNAVISVTTAATVKEDGLVITSGLSGKGTAANFKSDKENDCNLNADGEAVLATKQTESENESGNESGNENGNESGNGSSYVPYVPTTPVVTTHTIYFDANEGTGTMASQETLGATTISANKFTRKGYTFAGWNTKADGSGVSYTDKDSIAPSADITLYAQWKSEDKSEDKSDDKSEDKSEDKSDDKSEDKTDDTGKTGTDEKTETGKDETGTPVTKEEKAQAKADIDEGFTAEHTDKSVTIKWGAVEGAEKYIIYANYRGAGRPVKIATVSADKLSYTIKKLNGKKLDPAKTIKVYVKAFRTVDGEDVKLSKSIKAYIVGSENETYTNAKAIELEKDSYSIKAGKTAAIKAATVLEDASKKILDGDHVPDEFRYESSDSSIATVDANGVITAVSKGTCTIRVFAMNGISAQVKVTVK
ncbi:MAG: InlB B-repeat-containing protein [Lachnospiraceae bacterium]|nr:InlB B-repeat-containing protein [Lachnospiraceae bacterium]